MGSNEIAGDNRCDVAIVGGGIGGLALAYRLHVSGISVRVLEVTDRVGGWIRTEKRDGFLLEFGPNSLLKRPVLEELVAELGISESTVPALPSAKTRFLLHDTGRSDGSAKITPVPRGPLSALFTPLLSLRAKLRLVREPWVKCGEGDDESVYDFFCRRFGQELADNVIAPALSGVYAADIKRLSTRSALARLWEFEKDGGSVIRGGLSALMSRKRSSGKPKKSGGGLKIISFAGGLQFLPDTLAENLPVGSCRVLSSAQELRKDGDSWTVHYTVRTPSGVENESLSARRVVVTADTRAAVRLLEPFDREIAGMLKSLPYAPVGVLHLAVTERELRSNYQGFGCLIPPKLGFGLLGALTSSCIFPGRAPDGYHLLTCFAGGAVHPELADVTDKRIRDRVIAEVRNMFGFTRMPDALAETFHARAIPNYPLGHYKLQERVAHFEKANSGVRVLANWCKGIGVVDRLTQAETLAAEVRAELSV